jgi:hypothetical protein
VQSIKDARPGVESKASTELIERTEKLPRGPEGLREDKAVVQRESGSHT